MKKEIKKEVTVYPIHITQANNYHVYYQKDDANHKERGLAKFFKFKIKPKKTYKKILKKNY